MLARARTAFARKDEIILGIGNDGEEQPCDNGQERMSTHDPEGIVWNTEARHNKGRLKNFTLVVVDCS